MTQLADIFDDFPDWKDAGRRVEVELKDRSVALGTLSADDFFNNGEEEIPIFKVRLDDGREMSFVDAERFRYLDQK